VIITDTFPSQVTGVSANNGCGIGPNGAGCNVPGGLPSGQSFSATITVRAVSSGNAVNRVEVSWLDTAVRTASDSESTSITFPLEADSASERRLALQSALSMDSSGKTVRGRIVVNDAFSQETDSVGTHSYDIEGSAGLNRVAAIVDPTVSGTGTWRFDFSGTADLVDGSLRVESGDVLSMDGRSVVFAVGRGRNELRFSLRLRR
jgi:hypothetical protein